MITATDEATQQKAYASLNLHIINDAVSTDLWTAYDASGANGRGLAIDDYKRALCATMTGQNDSAISWLQRSIADDQTYVPALDQLVDLLSQSNRYKEVADLSAKHSLSHDVSQQTVILISQARAQTGDFQGQLTFLSSSFSSSLLAQNSISPWQTSMRSRATRQKLKITNGRLQSSRTESAPRILPIHQKAFHLFLDRALSVNISSGCIVG
ncbi:hypothetical protein [Tunturiibacter gelidiferens]|uniref:hypothetical protein n=1 Tax=Tunturiibacter gelidiferens TaxID=3069689 RepID=UPI003D9BFC5A